MLDVFKKMWPEAWGVRMEHILRNVLMALLEQPNATLHDMLRIFSDNEFRKKTAKSLRNDTVRTFLLNEFERFSFGYRADGTAPIQNKVGAFLADPLFNRILTAPDKDLHIRRIMDQGRVLLVNLAKGHIGEDSSSLIISFRVGVEDASYLVREFQPKFEVLDLLQVPNCRIYLKLMIDGMPSKPFSAITLDPASPPY
jgi:hypothetical protein